MIGILITQHSTPPGMNEVQRTQYARHAAPVLSQFCDALYVLGTADIKTGQQLDQIFTQLV